MTISLTPPPDLQVSTIDLPSETLTASEVLLHWTVENQGTGSADGTWKESVFLSADNTVGNDVLLVTRSFTDSLAPGGSRQRSQTVLLPEVADGNYRIVVVVDADNQIYEHLAEGNNALVSANSVAVVHPDLGVTAVTRPDNPQSGSVIPVNWTVWNQGTGTTQRAGWFDRVYLSTNPTIDSQDRLLAEATRDAGLQPAEAYTTAADIQLPQGVFGNFFLLVQTDATNLVRESTDEGNNVLASPLTIELAPSPDLTVAYVTGPAGLVVDNPVHVDITWTTRNTGSAGTGSSTWTDRVVLSSDMILGNADDVTLGDFSQTVSVPPGGQYARTAQVALPVNTTGTFYLHVITDAQNQIYEHNAENNNSASSLPFVVRTQQPSDLVVTELTAPSSATSGSEITVEWTVTNQGLGVTVPGVWKDRLVLSSDQTCGNADDIPVDLVDSLASLLPGASYIRRSNIMIPDEIEGSYYLFVEVDASQSVDEVFAEGNNALASSVPLSITLPPPPDLSVTAIQLPSSTVIGNVLQVGWTVTNAGGGPAKGTWRDTIYLSADDTFDAATDSVLFQVDQSRTLAAGASYSGSYTVVVPQVEDGDYRVFVLTDSAHTLGRDTDRENNLGRSNVMPIRHADLLVSSLAVPGTASSGEPIDVQWTVTNAGTGPTYGSVWYDRIYISRDTTLDALDAQLDELQHSGALGVGASYNRTLPVRLPDGISGTYYVLVQADSRQGILESTGDGNNVTAQRVDVTLSPSPDLVITDVQVPTSVLIGNPASLAITWTERNTGTGPGRVAEWVDRIVLSTDGTLGNSDDRVVREVVQSGLLAPGETRTTSRTVTLPADLLGAYHVFVVADARNEVYEYAGESNNVGSPANQLMVSPKLFADLVVSAHQTPGAVTAGERVDVFWTVTNQGTGNPNVFGWYDRVVLSTDDKLGNADDRTLGQFYHDGLVGVGDSYSAAGNVLIPWDARGAYELFIVTDAADAVYEFLYDANNGVRAAQAVVVTLGPTPDLEPAELHGPQTAVTASSIDCTWTAANVGERFAQGPWIDRIYISSDDDFDIAIDALVGSFTWQSDVENGQDYTRTEGVTLPALADGNYWLFVVTDANDSVYENEDEDNNVRRSSNQVRIVHPDLQVSSITVPASLNSGTEVAVQWTVENRSEGTTQTDRWLDKVYLSSDPIADASDLLLGQWQREGGLATGASYSAELAVTLPNGIHGSYYFLVQTDSLDAVTESVGEANNVDGRAAAIELSPYADLTPIDLTSPSALFIGHLTTIDVGWTVLNQGTGTGTVNRWMDRVFLSKDHLLTGDDLLVGLFEHTGLLDSGTSYSRSEHIPLPADLEGTYFVIVKTDGDDAIYEHQTEDNNIIVSQNTLSLLIEPYSDLVLKQIGITEAAFSGKSLAVNWTVKNEGLGLTNTGSWSDRVYLSKDALLDGQDALLGSFSRTGWLQVDQQYTRSVSVTLPEDIAGNHYLIVKADADNVVKEFLFEGNNVLASSVFSVTVSPAPDLVVTGIDGPTELLSGATFDLSWTVANLGNETAAGAWRDSIWLSRDNRIGGSDDVLLKSLVQAGPLAAGSSYARQEVLTLPENISGTFQILVQTDVLSQVYERDGENNNVQADNQLLQVTLSPRADLQITSVTVPETAGGLTTIGVQWEVINLGTDEPNTRFWTDRVYLSLDNVLDGSDALVGSVINPSTLRPGESYVQSLDGITIPRQFAGDAYIIVETDAGNVVREFPNDGNNRNVGRFEVIPIPPPDLIVPEVTSTRESFSGQTVTVRWMVQNQGPGVTVPDQWIDYVYLSSTRFGTSYFLGSFPHQGDLQRDESYIQVQEVRLPERISGDYYITVSTDALNSVFEFSFDTTGTPGGRDGNNLGSTVNPINVILRPPADLEALTAGATAEAQGGDTIHVSWTAANHGSEGTGTANWNDAVYLSHDNVVGNDVYIGSAAHWGALAVGSQYQGSGDFVVPQYFEFSGIPYGTPAKYVIVRVDANNGVFEGPYESNNVVLTQTTVTPLPKVYVPPPQFDLAITSTNLPLQAFSSEPIGVSWTVTNHGPDSIGTAGWTDRIVLSRDAIFGNDDDRYLADRGKIGPVSASGAYTHIVEKSNLLPAGASGLYYLIIKTDFHPNDLRGNLLETNENNNLVVAPILVSYTEPDLITTDVTLASSIVNSGGDVIVSWTVANQGNRKTTQAGWSDTVYLSRDDTIDSTDQRFSVSGWDSDLSGGQPRSLDIGESYTRSANIKIPINAEGRFYLLVAADGSGTVPEFFNEFNNFGSATFDVVLTPPPDLQVASVDAPATLLTSQRGRVAWTVTNAGLGATAAGAWTDTVYLSRDPNLDPTTDYQLGQLIHSGVLTAGQSYSTGMDFQVPAGIEGPYYVIIRTDSANNVFEHTAENNNVGYDLDAMLVSVPPPSDLVIDTITVPANALAGQNIVVSWTGSNVGPNAVTGFWSDCVYLSADTEWDIGDKLLGRVEQNRTLEVNAAYTAQVSVVTPGVLPGDYHFIVRSDIYNTIPEGSGGSQQSGCFDRYAACPTPRVAAWCAGRRHSGGEPATLLSAGCRAGPHGPPAVGQRLAERGE